MGRDRRRMGVIAAVTLVGIGCASSPTPEAERPDLAVMEEYGCGYGFWLGSPDGHLAVRLAGVLELAAAGELPRAVTLPDPAWEAVVLVGEDLYANWCDDVIVVGEPEPVVAEEWPITAGTIVLNEPTPGPDCPSEARATVTGLRTIRTDGTTVELGSRELTNDSWGCFAG